MRPGIVGGVLGGAAAAAAVAAERRASVRRRRRGVVLFPPLPCDRRGTVVAEDGTGIYYEEVGPTDAPLTLIFTHGYTLNLTSFYFQRKALQERFGSQIRMVFYDHRSHGRSEYSDRPYAKIDQLGRDLGTIIDTLAPRGQVILIGHSMGGMTILALAQARPDMFEVPGGRRGVARVAGVVLISTSAGGLASVTLGLPALLARIKGPLLPVILRGARTQADLVERGRAIGTDLAWFITRRLAFGSSDVPPACVEYLTTMIASTRIEVIADFYPALMSHDKLAALGLLDDIRVMIMCGDRDLLTPLEHSKAIAEALPKAELVVVPEGGHAMLLEQPEVADEALQRFVESVLDGSVPARKVRRA